MKMPLFQNAPFFKNGALLISLYDFHALRRSREMPHFVNDAPFCQKCPFWGFGFKNAPFLINNVVFLQKMPLFGDLDLEFHWFCFIDLGPYGLTGYGLTGLRGEALRAYGPPSQCLTGLRTYGLTPYGLAGLRVLLLHFECACLLLLLVCVGL